MEGFKHTMILCGKFVFAMITAPSCFIICTMTASSLAGLNAFPT